MTFCHLAFPNILEFQSVERTQMTFENLEISTLSILVEFPESLSTREHSGIPPYLGIQKLLRKGFLEF